MAGRTKLRSVRVVLDQDHLLPSGKYGYGGKWAVGGLRDHRHEAAENVLTTLPEPYYTNFKEAMKDGTWFVPMKPLWGKAAVFPQKIRVIYLNPVLEFTDVDVIENVVAHEILGMVQNRCEAGNNRRGGCDGFAQQLAQKRLRPVTRS